MKNNMKRRPLLIALVLVLIASIVLPAAAATVVGDVNGDGKVTVFDAQMLLEAQAGLRELTAEQQANVGNWTVQDLINSVLGIEEPSDNGVKVGDTFQSSQLAPTVANGENGMTIYHSDGESLTPFSTYDANNNGGRWYYITDENGMEAFVDPFVNAADNYGWIAASNYADVVIGYKMPANGKITLSNWLARHTAYDTQVKISKGNVANVIDGFDLVAGHENGMIHNTTMNVLAGEMVYISYKTAAESANVSYFGYKTEFTYTAIGVQEEEDVTVNKGDVFKFSELAVAAENGANGLTFYHTDGNELVAFQNYDPNNNNGRWYNVKDGAVDTFVDPFAVVADNYCLMGTSATEYTVAAYALPADGTIDLFTWAVTQAGTGHEVIVSLGSLNNVVGSYVTTQGTVAHTNYSLQVTKGQTLYLSYKPLEPAAGEWLGFQTSVTYTKLPVEVVAGSTFEGATLAPIATNGDNGVTLYYSDGISLTPYETKDPNTNGGRWYHNPYEDVIASFVDPAANVADNYGLIGSSAEEYVVMGYEMPASGQIQLDTWIALHTASPYRILISKGDVANVVAGRDVSGVTDTISYEHDSLNVDAGEMIYVSYISLAEGATSGGNYAGFKTGYTYQSVGIIDEETPTAVGTTFKSAELAGENNGDNGFTMYYTADGAALTAYELYDSTQGRWYEVTNDTVSFFDPQENVADNYGMAGNNATNYCVAAYEMPATGAVDFFTWTANQNGAGYQVSVALGSLNNVVATYEATEAGVPSYETHVLNVIAGQKVYVIYKPVSAVAGDWFGYINQYTYNSVG